MSKKKNRKRNRQVEVAVKENISEEVTGSGVAEGNVEEIVEETTESETKGVISEESAGEESGRELVNTVKEGELASRESTEEIVSEENIVTEENEEGTDKSITVTSKEGSKSERVKKSVFKKIREASKEYDSMVKEPSEKKDKIMSRMLYCFVIGMGLVILGTIISIGRSVKTIRKNNEPKETKDEVISCVADSVYQYDAISADDFVVSLEGKSYVLAELPNEYEYTIGKDTYVSDSVDIVINGESYSVKCNFISALDISWGYKESNTIPQEDIESISKEDIRGKISYEDGTIKEIEPDTVEISNENDSEPYLIISKDGSSYVWYPIVTGNSEELLESIEEDSNEEIETTEEELTE